MTKQIVNAVWISKALSACNDSPTEEKLVGLLSYC